ncbi:polysaccharide deacetylase family protein [Arthrobacter sp. ISL-69]|uniref:polysaccharide deacetylase family protein n=1 Tax=Arthrobacter sp. ISL-69 TaxID=2819113 RepID=UPI001BE5BBFA|nr:polysaccharide deacetylase family protein [Arthrobacter sp. ISL-69]MBT2536343.1 polysaccharide deacetylase family protein [Arthrobacter sp. ISL-69]
MRQRLEPLGGQGDPLRSGLTRQRKRATLWAVSSLAALALFTGSAALAPNNGPAPAGNAPGPLKNFSAPVDTSLALTTVTLTFDGGRASQLAAAQVLKSNGLRATFFVNSGFVGAKDYMTVEDLHALAADGNEIGGHTATLADLTALDPDEAKRQVCNDRTNLTDWGFKVTSFAYPFAAKSPEAEATVAGCGYNSARSQGDVRSSLGCADCAVSETVRPADVFSTRSTPEVGSAWTINDLQQAVMQAETAGGWLQLSFFDIDDSGSPRSVSPALFSDFVSWLATRTDEGTTAIRTVHDVIGGGAKPAVAGPAAPPAPPGVNALRNPGLETAGKYGLPECWQVSSYGENSHVLSTLTPGHSGGIARRLDVTGYASGDAKLLPVLDLGACAPSAVPGHSYTLRAWYTSTASTQFELYYRNKVGTWTYWTASPWFPASSAYRQAEWTAPPVPADAVGISFGLNLFSDGELATDDYEMLDTGTPVAP